MPWAVKKRCAYPLCPKLVHETYCDAHRKTKQNREAKQNRTRTRFYDTKEWIVVRNRYRKRNPICEHDHCNKPMHTVDHIIPIRAGGAKFDENNLQSLCFQCHQCKRAEEVGLYR